MAEILICSEKFGDKRESESRGKVFVKYIQTFLHKTTLSLKSSATVLYSGLDGVSIYFIWFRPWLI